MPKAPPAILIKVSVMLSFFRVNALYQIFSLLIFPIFFYDMTMNGIRYGLAFAFQVLHGHLLGI